ncbi:hypothetical protein OSG_eHP30_00125 [environmental Halophage eHP-30]|nr:hypothetical protein OSG_eHP30_00125 [environmental Halophage eHP-30]
MPIYMVQQDYIARDFVHYNSPEELAADKGYEPGYVRWVLEHAMNIHTYQKADLDLYTKLKHRCTDIELMRTLSITKAALERLKRDAEGMHQTHFGRHQISDLKKDRQSNVDVVHAQIKSSTDGC